MADWMDSDGSGPALDVEEEEGVGNTKGAAAIRLGVVDCAIMCMNRVMMKIATG